MGQQSSRIYIPGIGDHKDIYFNGKYHDKMYIGSQLVWEKIKEQIETNNVYIGKIIDHFNKFYALISLKGLSYSGSFASGTETSPLIRKAMYFAVGDYDYNSGNLKTIIFRKIIEVDENEYFVCISFDDDNKTVSAIGTSKAYIYDTVSSSVTIVEYSQSIYGYKYFSVNKDYICANQTNTGKYIILNYKDGSVKEENSLGALGLAFVLNGDKKIRVRFFLDKSTELYYCEIDAFSSNSTRFYNIGNPVDLLNYGFSVINGELIMLWRRENYVVTRSVSYDDGTISYTPWSKVTEFDSSFHARFLNGISYEGTRNSPVILTERDGLYGFNGNSELTDFFNDERQCKRVIWALGKYNYGTPNMWIHSDGKSKRTKKVIFEED